MKCYTTILILSIVLSGCISTGNEFQQLPETPKEERIPQLIQILHIAQGENYWRLCQEIISYREEALPHLEKNVTSASKNIRIGSIYCVSQIYKVTQSSAALKLKSVIATRLQDPIEKVQLEAAAALADMEDYQGVVLLIRTGLRSTDPNNRFSSFRALQNTFKVTFNYKYNGKTNEREESIQQWENWWHENQNKYLATK